MGRIRIVQLVTQMELGGAQKAMLTVAQGLNPEVYDVIPAVLYTKNRLNPVAEALGESLVDFKMKHPGDSWFKQVIGTFLGCFRLYRFLRQHRISILQTYCYYANVLGAVIGWLARVPIIVTSQRNSYHSMGRLALLLDRLAATIADRTIAVCEATRRFSIEREGFDPERIVTVHNGIEVSETASVESAARPADSIVMVCPARLFKKKGVSYLLEAVALLPSTLPWLLWIVGDGPERRPLDQQIEALGLGDRVSLFGWRKDVLALMAASDIVVLPSLEEGFPNVLLEAMALKKPIVATDVDGNSEAVSSGITGFLVAAGDSAGLSDALARLCSDADLRLAMGEAGYLRVATQFTKARMLEGFEKVYQGLLEPISQLPKLLLVCSSGGHLLQLHLLEEWWSGYPRVWCTFPKIDATSMLAHEKVYWAHYPTNRNLTNLLLNWRLAVVCLWKEKPKIVVSTGAGVAVPFLLTARIMGIKTIFIEEFNRVSTPTLTGRIVYRFVDRFLIQWPELKKYYPKASYKGSIL